MKKLVLAMCIVAVSGFASCGEYREMYREANDEYKRNGCDFSPLLANTNECKEIQQRKAQYEYMINNCDLQKQQLEQQKELLRIQRYGW